MHAASATSHRRDRGSTRRRHQLCRIRPYYATCCARSHDPPACEYTSNRTVSLSGFLGAGCDCRHSSLRPEVRANLVLWHGTGSISFASCATSCHPYHPARSAHFLRNYANGGGLCTSSDCGLRPAEQYGARIVTSPEVTDGRDAFIKPSAQLTTTLNGDGLE